MFGKIPDGWETGIVFGCMHIPFQDGEKVAQMVEVIKREKPDHVICTGDVLDADGASRFPSEFKHDLLDEYEMVDVAMNALRQAAPEAEHVWISGNHEDNISRLGRIPKGVRRMCQPTDWVKEWNAWKHVPYINEKQYAYRVGQVTVLHGFKFGGNSDRDESVEFGVDWGLTVRSHTHRLMPVTRSRISLSLPLDRWHANVGTLCDIEFFKGKHYAKRTHTREWAPGYLKFVANPRRQYFGSKQWEAETVEL